MTMTMVVVLVLTEAVVIAGLGRDGWLMFGGRRLIYDLVVMVIMLRLAADRCQPQEKLEGRRTGGGGGRGGMRWVIAGRRGGGGFMRARRGRRGKRRG